MFEIDPISLSYDLPKSRIAQYPLCHRSASRLLVVDSKKGVFKQLKFYEILDFIQKEDLVIFNTSKVVQARFDIFYANKKKSLLFVEWLEDGKIKCIGPNLRDISSYSTLKGENAKFTIISVSHHLILQTSFNTIGDWFQWLGQYGKMPLPAYIKRDVKQIDTSRYQSVFANFEGSVASPTAGLHFDQKLISEILKKGAHITSIQLHCGIGTFSPIRNSLNEHSMSSETYTIQKEAIDKITDTKYRGKKIIAVGTTVVRAIESFFLFTNNSPVPGTYTTTLFIKPGYSFKVANTLVTNFHAPCTTPLSLAIAFTNRAVISEAYSFAIDRKFRFLSYGDSMLLGNFYL
ncbi:MAG: tRNA preQ1(34) S-adenosylmethionine ribosyltransferase-isomerase QueA [Methylacidiphilales bacterium]|nr:tRNA preQ1(34) S-adenosylmethionine ribosyltransferase-isomerase QueA [Candidatus Methylacidiphilales bacterium]